MSSGRAIACHEHQANQIDATLEFLKRTRSELRMLRKVRVYRDRLQVVDVNGDWFEVSGLGYPDVEVERVLRFVNAAYNRETIHDDVADEFKELNAGRRYPWAADRVM
jgi:hypothetical protein